MSAAETAMKEYLDVWLEMHKGKLGDIDLSYEHGWIRLRHIHVTRKMRVSELRALTARGRRQMEGAKDG